MKCDLKTVLKYLTFFFETEVIDLMIDISEILWQSEDMSYDRSYNSFVKSSSWIINFFIYLFIYILYHCYGNI